MNLSWQHLLAFLFAVGLLVTVHEFGHYWVARRLGFKVLRFSVGFGKPLFKRVAGADKTEYVIAAIPLGGYVKLLDEREAPVDAAEVSRAFNRRPHWQRILVLLAGPAFNIIFAVLLLAALFWANGVTHVRAVVGDVIAESPAARGGLRSGDEIRSIDGDVVRDQSDVVMALLEQMAGDGRVLLAVAGKDGAQRETTIEVADGAERRQLTVPENLLRGLGFGFYRPPVPAVLGRVLPDGTAAAAGLLAGDEVVSINGTAIVDFYDMARRIEAHAGDSVLITVKRAGQEMSLRVNVAVVEDQGKRVGRIRVEPPARIKLPPEMVAHSAVGPVAALAMGAEEAWRMTALQARVFWRMIQGHVSLKNLSGPLTIAEYAGDTARSGPAAFASFLVLISLSLGFLNLLPIPILDGGQVVYQLVEWIKGSPLSERAQVVGQQVGIGLLVLMMGVALFNDILRQFG
ncbi:MAG: RIP metalloprotease RseP [Proteobacteria bacterium]|nr:RIP metalloprotease RseP [Pseudomonadota bacterium]MBK9251017.1 RIP metalloprotease RseP [Pseudomonadota bacterium]MCC6632443.1 RIP metalloprotease RseP [Gammaproteobacteria bacterium]